jgi:hypothetical protein
VSTQLDLTRFNYFHLANTLRERVIFWLPWSYIDTPNDSFCLNLPQADLGVNRRQRETLFVRLFPHDKRCQSRLINTGLPELPVMSQIGILTHGHKIGGLACGPYQYFMSQLSTEWWTCCKIYSKILTLENYWGEWTGNGTNKEEAKSRLNNPTFPMPSSTFSL